MRAHVLGRLGALGLQLPVRRLHLGLGTVPRQQVQRVRQTRGDERQALAGGLQDLKEKEFIKTNGIVGRD